MKKLLLLIALLAMLWSAEANAQNRYFKRDSLTQTAPGHQAKASVAKAQSRSYKGDSLIQIVPRYQGEVSVGYVFVAGVGMGWGIQTIHGRRTSDLFYTGFGLGVDLYYIPSKPHTVVGRFVNIFYNARWYLLRDKPVQLMLNLNAGLGTGTILGIVPFSPHVSIGVGASYKVSPRSAINAMLSYDNKFFSSNGVLHGLSLRIGFQF